MKLRLQFAGIVLLIASAAPAWPQSEGDAPLGDVARNIRKAKVATKPAEVRVDNDNFSNIMENSEARRMRAMTPQLGLALGPATPGTPFTAADVNCSLSFSAHGIRLTDSLGPAPATPTAAQSAAQSKDKEKEKEKDDKTAKEVPADNSIPPSEIAKLEGPATIIGDSLQLSVYNGTSWLIEEITVGLTILRHPSKTATVSENARIVPASSVQIVAKRSDTLVVYHFKGSAAPSSRATFTQPLGINLSSDQEWHWAIIDAKGTPPKASAATPDPKSLNVGTAAPARPAK